MPRSNQRTREAIVSAAIETWATNMAAPLGEVANAAGVGRTTLHRHYPDRDSLISAVDDTCQQQFAEATRRARPDEGTGAQALGRVLGELLGLGAPLGLIFADNAVVDPDSWPDSGTDGDTQLIMRGQRDGSIDPGLPARWVSTTFWTTLFGGHLLLREGEATLREVADLAVQTFTRGISSPDAEVSRSSR